MALQIRRGTDTERQGITPKAGEPIFVTDTKKLFIGDGSTAGGVQVDTNAGLSNVIEDTSPQLGGTLDLNNQNITGTGNINISGIISASAMDLKGSVFADDSTLLIDGISGTIPASNLTGIATIGVIGDVTGTLVGSVTGELVGSVFADDSTPLLDGVNKKYLGDIETGRLTVSNPNQPGDGLNGGVGEVNIDVTSNDNRSLLNLRRASASSLAGDTTAIYGTVTFGRNDADGLRTTAIIFGRENGLFFGNTPDGVFNQSDIFCVWKEKRFGIGTTTPNEALDVNGNASVSGAVLAAGFVGDVIGDDSAVIVDASSGAITAQNFVQFGSLTTTERNALTAANGMVIYNTTDNKFQGYENGAWVNLV